MDPGVNRSIENGIRKVLRPWPAKVLKGCQYGAERFAEVHAYINTAFRWPNVVLAQHTGQALRSKFRPRFVNPKVLESSATIPLCYGIRERPRAVSLRYRSGESKCRRASGDEEREETHDKQAKRVEGLRPDVNS